MGDKADEREPGEGNSLSWGKERLVLGLHLSLGPRRVEKWSLVFIICEMDVPEGCC